MQTAPESEQRNGLAIQDDAGVALAQQEFLKQEYLTLREEIRDAKGRMFWLMVLGTLLIPVNGFMANYFNSAFAAASMPFVFLVVMLAFMNEQNSIVRAGRYLKDHVEPRIQGVIGWEHWLESNRRLREVDRAFVGSFFLILFLFYALGTATAMKSIPVEWYENYWYAGIGYGVGGIWFLIVMVRHWHAFTTTKD